MVPDEENKEDIAGYEKYLRDTCMEQLKKIANATEERSHYAVDVDVLGLFVAFPVLFNHLQQDAIIGIQLLETAIQNILKSLNGTSKVYVHPRLEHIPTASLHMKPQFSMLRTRDVGRILAVMGTVIRTGSVMLREVSREFICRKCKETFLVTGDLSQRGAFDVPSSCPNVGKKPCYGSSFAPVENGTPECREYQEIKLQEKVHNLDVGTIPRSIIVILTDDLADSVKPGDDVLVSGILYRRWNKPILISECRADVELMLVALHVESSNEAKSYLHVSDESKQLFVEHWGGRSPREQLQARNVILRSMCPQIYGMYLLKLIVAMTVIGGVPYTDPSGSRIRGESHLLIVGDPGTAKSQILRYSAKVSPRSVLTTGIGTTSAGLTVTAVREAGTGEWMLDAGALVLADGGVCCIDEFDGIKQHDRGAIHEAMEQQTLSVAKAGLVCTLDTRATVIAAVNPKNGKISTEIGSAEDRNGVDGESLSISVGIASPLLSRFDVILTLLDQRNEDWDRQLSSFILNSYSTSLNRESPEAWSTDRLRQYFYHIKTTIHPRLSSAAMKLLTTYYTLERSAANRNTARTTVRLLQALVRLAQAHARLMFRNVATGVDAVFAIAAVEASAASLKVVGGMGALHAPFPEDPAEQFEEYARYILCKLGLEEENIQFYDDTAMD